MGRAGRERKRGELGEHQRGSPPHRDHSLVIEVYRMVIKQRGALISLPQPECLSEEHRAWTGRRVEGGRWAGCQPGRRGGGLVL